MAWIRIIPAAEATVDLAELYRRPLPAIYRPTHEGLPNILRVHSLDPTLMRALFGWSSTLATDETLSWAQRELVNTITSRLNQCFY